MIENVSVPPGEKGKWRVSRFIITENDAKLANLLAVFNGRGHVSPGLYTSLTCDGRGIVMSDTPDEKRDHYAAVRNAYGHVLINGLGLGMVLGAIMKKDAVARVTVIEIDQDVIDLVGPHYASEKLEIVNASAFDYKPPKGTHYGAVWHDIWDNICSDNLAVMTRLKRKYARRTNWQGCWAESECRRRA